MPDISLCANQGCTKRGKCYRYLAVPSSMQSMSWFGIDDECEYYWEILDEEVRDLCDVDKITKTNYTN